MKSWQNVSIGVLAIWALGGCGLREESSVAPEEPLAPVPEDRIAAKSASLSLAQVAAESVPRPREPQRLVIKTAHLELEIEHYDPWMSQVQELVKGYKGYIVSSAVHQISQNARRGELTIRVPEADFERLLAALKGSAREVEGEQLGGQDVTEEFFDLEARLENQRRTERRFQEILQAAKNVEEILAVERELSRVREEIDRLEGRRRYLQDRVALAMVSVEWHEPYPLGNSQGKGVWDRIANGFERGLEELATVLEEMVAFAIAVLPVAVLLGGGVWGVIRLIRRRKSQALL